MPARRLASILDEHAPEGCDFRVHRPRVMLVEATWPMSSVPSHGAWEAMLTGAGYQFVFFDGLNRFYVADEWMAALAPHFTVPVNVGDDYVRVSDAAWARRSAAQDAALAHETARALTAEDSALAAYARAFEQARDLGLQRVATDQAREEAAGLRQSLHAREQDILAQRARLDAATRLLDATHRSTSWRVTRPVRALSILARLGRLAKADTPLSEPLPPLVPRPLMEAPPAGVPAGPATAPAPGLIRTVHQFHSGSALGDAVDRKSVV